MQKIKVVIVDDSAVMRLRLKKILEKDPEITVVGIAKNGAEALSKITQLKPMVVTMDVEMPTMNGLEALENIMRYSPVPVVMLSALTAQGTEATLKALELGAVDFVKKPGYEDTKSLELFEQDFPAKIKLAAKSYVGLREKVVLPDNSLVVSPKKQDIKLVAIGCSTGGPAALQQIIPFLPGGFPAAVVIVQHIPKGFTGPMASRLDKISALKVTEAREGMAISPGNIYIAPAGHVFSFRKAGTEVRVVLDGVETSSPFKPSVDDMMLSAADVYAGEVLGVILTGMGSDGIDGMRAIKENKGKTIAQGESSCVVFGMPKAAIEAGTVDKVADLSVMCETIVKNVV